jgi:hypothetical protein
MAPPALITVATGSLLRDAIIVTLNCEAVGATNVLVLFTVQIPATRCASAAASRDAPRRATKHADLSFFRLHDLTSR